MLFLSKAAVLLACLWFHKSAISHPTSTTADESLPTVDLGYQLQRATVYNSTGHYLNFSNIRFARPPVGNLRFREPQPPLVNRSQVFTGELGRICPQADTTSTEILEQYLPQYLLHGRTNWQPSDFNITSNNMPAQDPRSTEDCLFLDVMVPQKIFANREKRKAPVLVWIYGGGYTMGSKESYGSAAGLIARSTNGEGLVYVAINYRLGAFGWLSGPSVQASGGNVNVGLYDQRLALEWIQQHISKFGGDPNHVTIMGESAGGGSVLSQMAAFGGERPVPFQRAILQSPALQPYPSAIYQEDVFRSFLELLDVTTLDEARSLPYEKLQAANIHQVGLSPFGQYTYGPVPDGAFLPQIPGVLLASGRYAKDLQVMVGHNSNEGLFFASPFVSSNTAFVQNLFGWLPSLRAFPKVTDYIVNKLYPPIFDGSQAYGYHNEIARTAALSGDLLINCNTVNIANAFHNQTYSYLFGVIPGIHGEDLPYTFYNGPSSDVKSPQQQDLAVMLQRYITHFAETGDPNQEGVPHFPQYGDQAMLQVLNLTGTHQATDQAASKRCDFWSQGLYY